MLTGRAVAGSEVTSACTSRDMSVPAGTGWLRAVSRKLLLFYNLTLWHGWCILMVVEMTVLTMKHNF